MALVSQARIRYTFPDKDAQLKNKEIPLQINLKKLDSETNEYVAGAEYALYAREDITNVLAQRSIRQAMKFRR